MFDLKFGFQTFRAPNQQFCLDSVKGCPIVSGQPFVIQRSFNLTSHSLYPLVDITARYSAIDADSNHLVCIHLAPVGYQDPMWRKIFIFLPVGLTVSAAIISLIGSFIRFEDSEHDIFLFSSNYAMLPGILRLKTPGFFDLVFYAQFVVISGLFNIDYPRFQSLFTSNFAWSFLLFKSAWLQDVFQQIFTSYSSPVQEIGSIEGTSIYKRQLSNETDNNSFDISGTSMLNFATASGIDINALFLTFLVHLAILIAACATCCFVTWAFLFIVGKLSPEGKLSKQSTKVLDFSIGMYRKLKEKCTFLSF
ncbi:hypothetical protein EDC96DRAFT_502131 [Choanephora cucurbitarum]|nr:hypothetical protein EDC96DRAFT_502131 [Choanephora cucurbitarum]